MVREGEGRDGREGERCRDVTRDWGTVMGRVGLATRAASYAAAM